MKMRQNIKTCSHYRFENESNGMTKWWSACDSSVTIEYDTKANPAHFINEMFDFWYHTKKNHAHTSQIESDEHLKIILIIHVDRYTHTLSEQFGPCLIYHCLIGALFKCVHIRTPFRETMQCKPSQSACNNRIEQNAFRSQLWQIHFIRITTNQLISLYSDCLFTAKNVRLCERMLLSQSDDFTIY